MGTILIKALELHPLFNKIHILLSFYLSIYIYNIFLKTNGQKPKDSLNEILLFTLRSFYHMSMNRIDIYVFTYIYLGCGPPGVQGSFKNPSV